MNQSKMTIFRGLATTLFLFSPPFLEVDCFATVEPTSSSTSLVGLRKRTIPNSTTKLCHTGPSSSSSVDDDGGDDGDDAEVNKAGNISNIQSWLTKRLDRTNLLEVRLDATLISCYVLARFLAYDISSGAKENPGWNIDDWVRILSAISSAIILSFCWTLSGLSITRSFDDDVEEEKTLTETPEAMSTMNNRDIHSILLTVANTIIAVPLWLFMEHIFHFGPPGLDFTDFNTAEQLFSTGLGLACTMVAAKKATNGWQ